MGAVVADTHALIWYIAEPEKLTSGASAAFEQAVESGDPIYISAISVVEFFYLVEKGRLPEIAFERLISSLNLPESAIYVTPLDLNIAQSMKQIPRDVVPDMPDRIIAATALYLNLPLITRDKKIRNSGIEIIW
jgi:PIN domain nuclease of toxin-antitoxin system